MGSFRFYRRVHIFPGLTVNISKSGRQTPYVPSHADEMRGSGTHPQTAALFPSPIHAKFLNLGKLCKALRPSWT